MSNINQEIEIWKEIEGYDGKYLISSHGNVKSLKYKNPKLLKFGWSTPGYKIVILSKSSVCKTVMIHRLVAKYFIPNPDNKPQVNHKDGDKLNNNLSNLEWSTGSENINHAIDNGLLKITGSSQHGAILKERDVEFIRANYMKYTYNELAKMFKVKNRTISAVIKGKIWNRSIKNDTIDKRLKLLINMETGIFYDSIEDACKTTPFKISSFYAMLSGKQINRTSFIKL